MENFFNNLWDRPVHMLIVVCVLLSIMTMVINFLRGTIMERRSSGPVEQVAEVLEKNRR